MNTKFTIFVVCATVVQTSLAILSSITSAGIPAECQLDFSILDAYHAVADLQANKVIEGIFARERQVYLTRTSNQDINSSEDNLSITETCNDELLTSWLASFDATLEAIHVVYPGNSSNTKNARTIGAALETVLVGSICSVIELALGNNDTGALAEIQAILDEQAPAGATNFNAAYFDVIQNDSVANSRIKLVIENYKRKSTSKLISGVTHIFHSLQALLSIGTETGSQDISDAIDPHLNRAFSEIQADIEIKLELLKTMLAASCVIQFGIVPDSLFSQNIKNSALSGYEEENHEYLPTGEEEENHSEIMAHSRDNQTAREATTIKAVEGTTALFSTMEDLSVKVHKNKHVAEDNLRRIETGKAETTAAWTGVLDIIFGTIPTSHPASSLQVQNAAKLQLQKGIDGFYMEISSTQGNDCSKILDGLQNNETKITNAFVNVVNDIYLAMRKNLKFDDKSKATLDRTQKATISNCVKVCKAVFSSIRMLVAAIFPEAPAESDDCSSSMKAEQKEAVSQAKDYVKNVFDAMDSLRSTYMKIETETPDDSCAATIS